MKKKGVWCYKQLGCFFICMLNMVVSVPIWWNTSSMGRLEATQTNFLWLLRTNDEALCVCVWVAHLALEANNLCVCVCFCLFPCALRDTYLLLCIWACVCICVYALSDVCVNVPTHAHNPESLCVCICVCTFVPSVCLACLWEMEEVLLLWHSHCVMQTYPE